MTRRTFVNIFASLAIAGAVALASAETVTTYTNGNGSASEPDRGQAMDEATQQAQNWANSTCIGMVTQTETVSSNCIKTGSDEDNTVSYTCMVNVRDTCEIQTRGRYMHESLLR